MEVSSIALAADRVREVAFDVVAFTNLTQDHLDWHGSMEAYAAAKEQLFFDYGASAAVVVVDQPFGVQLAERLSRRGGSRVVRVSTEGPADVSVTERRLDLAGVELELSLGGAAHRLVAPLAGEHNVQNLACAAGIAWALDLDLEAALGALARVPQVPGRLELVSQSEDDVAALVDYAHTPDALARVLATLRPHVQGRLWCVFGCGGDRDPTKRGPMGAAVARGADVAVVTNDNPRSEDPEAIAEAVVDGLTGAGVEDALVELDRAKAIGLAVKRAAPGDVVLVAGKGHETYQIIGDRELSFDDRLVLGDALSRRRAKRPERPSPKERG
jgi:UDP-N-acetylmuramoyl-L-alanyl-D-glutamate--2,6-diaminopimelate ligase